MNENENGKAREVTGVKKDKPTDGRTGEYDILQMCECGCAHKNKRKKGKRRIRTKNKTKQGTRVEVQLNATLTDPLNSIPPISNKIC